jgi:hypothetical protein
MEGGAVSNVQLPSVHESAGNLDAFGKTRRPASLEALGFDGMCVLVGGQSSEEPHFPVSGDIGFGLRVIGKPFRHSDLGEAVSLWQER